MQRQHCEATTIHASWGGGMPTNGLMLASLCESHRVAPQRCAPHPPPNTHTCQEGGLPEADCGEGGEGGERRSHRRRSRGADVI